MATSGRRLVESRVSLSLSPSKWQSLRCASVNGVDWGSASWLRSDDKNKGINKISMLDYCQLPGLLAERLFSVLDTDGDAYLNSKEFLTGLLRFYCSTFD